MKSPHRCKQSGFIVINHKIVHRQALIKFGSYDSLKKRKKCSSVFMEVGRY